MHTAGDNSVSHTTQTVQLKVLSDTPNILKQFCKNKNVKIVKH